MIPITFGLDPKFSHENGGGMAGNLKKRKAPFRVKVPKMELQKILNAFNLENFSLCR